MGLSKLVIFRQLELPNKNELAAVHECPTMVVCNKAHLLASHEPDLNDTSLRIAVPRFGSFVASRF